MIKTIDRSACKTIRESIDAHLEQLDIPGVVVKLGNGSFLPGENVTFKLEVALKTADGTVLTKSASDWKAYCYRWGFKPDDLGKKFRTPAGDIVTITGCKPRSTKFPILAKNSRGTAYKYPPRALQPI